MLQVPNSKLQRKSFAGFLIVGNLGTVKGVGFAPGTNAESEGKHYAWLLSVHRRNKLHNLRPYFLSSRIKIIARPMESEGYGRFTKINTARLVFFRAY